MCTQTHTHTHTPHTYTEREKDGEERKRKREMRKEGDKGKHIFMTVTTFCKARGNLNPTNEQILD